MSDKEKEKFREHMNKFTREQLVGWQSAISFILPMKEVSPKLRDKLVEMFDICDDVIDERSNSKEGHWIRFKSNENGYYHIKCSECGQYWSVDGHANVFKYCFNCGKKMQGVMEV